jgi:hypothetical protein
VLPYLSGLRIDQGVDRCWIRYAVLVHFRHQTPDLAEPNGQERREPGHHGRVPKKATDGGERQVFLSLVAHCPGNG